MSIASSTGGRGGVYIVRKGDDGAIFFLVAASMALKSFTVALMKGLRELIVVFQSYCRMGLLALGSSGHKGQAAEPLRPAAAGALSPCVFEAPLLRPPSPSNRRKLTIVLDLDETLVCAYTERGVPANLRALAQRGLVKSFELLCECDGPGGAGGRAGRQSKIVVFERPGLREFLRRASSIAELVLFTAGLEGYASSLCDSIDPEGHLSARLYRDSCVSTRGKDHVKDLSRLGRDLSRTLLVDNNPFSFMLQPANGIPIAPFAGEPGDEQLLGVLLPLLESLAMLSDVRPLLSARFHMGQWFQMQGLGQVGGGGAGGWDVGGGLSQAHPPPPRVAGW